MKTTKLKLLATAAVIGGEALLTAGPAFAQIEQIIVEARKREENLQDVPLAVTAFNEDFIERTQANTINEFEKFIPNVEFSNIEFSGQTLGASIRGVSFADLEKTFEPAVGFSIDGVFLASNTGASIDVFDIESIEVLRGPQGTLYGRNTVGGVINVQRTRPTGEFGVRAATRIGNNGQREYLGVLNLPEVGDLVSSKFYFFRDLGQTFAKNFATGERDPGADSYSFGAAFLVEPNDRFQALLQVDAIDDNSNGAPVYNLTLPQAGNFCEMTIGFAAAGLLPADQAEAGCRSQSFDRAEATDFEFYVRDFPFVNELNGYSVSSNIEYELTDQTTLTSITGYRNFDDELFEENLGAPSLNGVLTGGVPTPIFVAHRIQNSTQFSQELRIDGPFGDNIDYVAGLYYLNADYDIQGGDGPFGDALGTGTAFVLGAAVNDFTAAQETNAVAGFFDATWQITDRFSFSGGARVSYENKDFDINFINPDFGPVSVSENWLRPTGRGIFQYQFSDDVMGFAGWSRGFRSGGFNGRATAPSAVGPYDPETVDSYEAGMRMEFFNNTLRFNPTAFYANYQDKQEEIIRASPSIPDVTETIVENASSVAIWGVEVEGVWQPNEYFSFQFSGGYLGNEIDEFIVDDIDLITPTSPRFDPTADPLNLPQIDVADTRILRRAPQFSFAVGGQYRRTILNGAIDMSFAVDYSYNDDFAASPVIDTFPGETRHIVPGDGSADFNLRLETTNESGANIALTGFINDAFDDRRGQLSNTLDAGVFWFAAGQPTRVYGLQAEFFWN